MAGQAKPSAPYRKSEYVDATSHVTVTGKVLSRNISVHWHEYFELEIVTDGKGTNIKNKIPQNLTAGSWYLMTPADYHQVITDGDVVMWNISFSDNRLSQQTIDRLLSSRFPRSGILRSEDVARAENACRMLETEDNRHIAAKTCLLEYLLHVLWADVPGGEEGLSVPEQTGAWRAVEYLKLHFRESPSLATVARETGYAKNYLCEQFRKQTGRTFYETLTALKLDYAATLLTEGVSVAETCFTSGFGSLSTFQEVFRRRFGISPGSFRRQHLIREDRYGNENIG